MKALLALILLSTAALAQDRAPNAGMPPIEFRGDTMSMIIFTSDVSQYCGRPADPSLTIVACTFLDKGIVVLPNPCPRGDAEFFARIACHENGHRAGWRH